MTINDLQLNEYVRELHRASSRLDYLTREGKEGELFIELSNAERAANLAQNRLNHLKFKRKVAA
jgi:hypothetical protein